jgi:limonene-1,2-epoxide hydrolase
MQVTNKELIRKINEAFSNGNVRSVSSYIDENIRWKIIGMPVICGKEDFIKMIEMMALECSSSAEIKNIIAEGDFVVVEGSCIANNRSNRINPSFCEIYLIQDGKIKELTSYIVDISANDND